MKCETLIRIDEKGQRITKPKKQYATMDEAIADAKKRNLQPETIHKVVAYKCNVCFKYHVGRTNKIVSDKDRNHLKKQINFKVVGRINL